MESAQEDRGAGGAGAVGGEAARVVSGRDRDGRGGDRAAWQGAECAGCELVGGVGCPVPLPHSSRIFGFATSSCDLCLYPVLVPGTRGEFSRGGHRVTVTGSGTRWVCAACWALPWLPCRCSAVPTHGVSAAGPKPLGVRLQAPPNVCYHLKITQE